ncbi:MAG: methyltransferase domain-containing protein [Clostridia bacterium]|nr:methyltransferase domain-containing protein [Clostridia bacterium]
MVESYSALAPRYDELMADVDYAGYADFYEKLIGEYAPSAPKKLVDLGCGTGSVSVLMAKKGFEVCGIDISCEMLTAAYKKASDERVKIIFAEQDMTRLDVGEGWGAVICSFDGMNYLKNARELGECFFRSAQTLEQGGMFIFDLNTKYKYENVIDGNTFVYELEDLMLIWQNYYKRNRGVCDFYLTFFEKDGTVWHRIDEYQSQKMFSDKTVRKLLDENGFELIKTCSDINGAATEKTSERVFYICRKK